MENTQDSIHRLSTLESCSEESSRDIINKNTPLLLVLGLSLSVYFAGFS